MPDPIPAPSQGEVEGAYRTLDGRWLVEAVRRGNDQFFRLVHAGNVVDGLDIVAVKQLLARAGVSMADLVATDPAAPPDAQPGVA